MKKFAFPILLLIFCLYGCQQVEKPVVTTELGLLTNYNFQPQILHGQVKSVSEKSYLVSEENGEFVKGELLSDSLRNKIPWSWDFTAEYDRDGVVTWVEYYEDAGPSDHWEIESESRAVTKASHFSKDTLGSYFLMKNDANGHIVSAERFTAGVDTLTDRYGYVCNEMGRWIEVTSLNLDGSLDRKYTWDYNEENLLLERDWYDAADSLLGKNIYEYDDQGNFIGRQLLNGDMSMYAHETHQCIKSDDMGNCLQTVYWLDGELTAIDERTITYYEE